MDLRPDVLLSDKVPNNQLSSGDWRGIGALAFRDLKPLKLFVKLGWDCMGGRRGSGVEGRGRGTQYGFFGVVS